MSGVFAAPSRYPFLGTASKKELGLLYTIILEYVGYFTTKGKPVANYGIDYVLYRPDGSEPEAAMHCRPGRHPPVGLSDVKQFWEVASGEGYERAMIVTYGTVSPSAKEFCRTKDYLVVDAEKFDAGLDDLSPVDQLEIFRTYEKKRGEKDESYFTAMIQQLEAAV